MVGILATMTAFMKKLKRRRKLSTELHSRWGDVSITYPNEGSWSQWDQRSGFAANVPEPSPPEVSPRRGSVDSHAPSSRRPSAPQPRDTSCDEPSEDLGMNIPTGYYEPKLRTRPTQERKESYFELGTGDHGYETRNWDNAENGEVSDNDAEDSRREIVEPSACTGTAEDADGSFQRPARSPPLWVTSRMRRHSSQSNPSEPPTSTPGTGTSQHAPIPPLSSSAPTAPLDDPRIVSNSVYHDKKQAQTSKHRELEPALTQELVPSYDELYG